MDSSLTRKVQTSDPSAEKKRLNTNACHTFQTVVALIRLFYKKCSAEKNQVSQAHTDEQAEQSVFREMG